jgi:hypothetical protein
MADQVAPPGWPRDLPPPYADEFAQSVTGWLLNRGPGQWRSHAVLRRRPRALARLVADHLTAELEGLRRSYAGARRTLVDIVPADDMDELLAAIESEGAVVAESLRQVEQVSEALAGKQWRARL